MTYFRPILLKKLEEFLRGGIKRDDVYRWALSQVVLPRYEEEVREDPLLKETMQAMVDISRQDSEVATSMESLKYYRKCLRGDIDYLPKEDRDKKNMAKKGDPKDDFLLATRIYVILFAACSMFINIVSIVNPDFLRIGLFPPTRIQAFFAAFPHLVYATFLFISPKTLAKGRIYSMSLVILLVGVAYYWMVAFSFVSKLLLHSLMVIVVAPFSGVPATLALILLIRARKESQGVVQKS